MVLLVVSCVDAKRKNPETVTLSKDVLMDDSVDLNEIALTADRLNSSMPPRSTTMSRSSGTNTESSGIMTTPLVCMTISIWT